MAIPDTPSWRPPSTDQLARSLADTGLPHPLLVDIARLAIAEAADAEEEADSPERRSALERIPERARAIASTRQRRLLQPVVNATGVLLHTNLGRSPLGFHQDASYTNLELDLDTGSRGSRYDHAGDLLARVCGAEAAMVTNNCAAAVMLSLAALASGRGVAVSRGELVEIGGGFRVPEVLEQSGARLVEVGTTNRTRRADYASAIENGSDEIAVLLKVHQSNYEIVGFTEDTSVAELAELANLGPYVVVDLGSGLVDSTCPWLDGPPPTWLEKEPAVRQTLAAGADLVMFSGDKLLGGPQAGIIAGSRELVDRCARHPMARAVRPGGLILHALQQTALAYLRRDGSAIPLWRMVAITTDELSDRATQIRAAAGVHEVSVVASVATPGGGTVPGAQIPSVALSLAGDHTANLRAQDPPIVGRMEDQATLLDLRTVAPDEDAHLIAALQAVATSR